jgi:aspartate/glutamate racemase
MIRIRRMALKNNKQITVLQTSFAKRDDTVAYLEENIPGVRVTFITESHMLEDIRDSGEPSPSVIKRAAMYTMAAAEAGADLILFSCSTMGDAAELCRKLSSVPVVRIDEPMAAEAVALGDNIALISTLMTTQAPSRRLIERLGREAGKAMKIESRVVSEAWEALSAGDTPKHNKILMDNIRELDKKGFDVIVMAQVSMRALLPDLADVATPLLCSFYSGLNMVVSKLREM